MTRVYLRTTMVKRRKPVMQGWADHCDGNDADNVLAFEKRARRSVSSARASLRSSTSRPPYEPT